MRMEIKMEKMSQKALERKSNKPIMEKKRRARINHCLNQLKSLILEADNERSRHSKLEKADILEMTVKYLQTLRAYHVQLNQINQLQAQQQSQQHQQLQHHFQKQLTQNLKLVSPLHSAPHSPIDLQMPVSLAQLPLPLQLSLQAAAASHQLPQSSPEVSPKSSSSSSASTASSSPRLQPLPANTQSSNSHPISPLQQAHQNQQQQHLQHQLSRHQQQQLSQHLSQLQHHHHALAHQQATLSPTWRPW